MSRLTTMPLLLLAVLGGSSCDSTTPGTGLGQWACGDGANQKWEGVDLGNGYVRLKLGHIGIRADLASQSESNGVALVQPAGGDGTSQQERLRDRQRNASVLDAVVGQLGAFKAGLGAADRARLDTYAENIRELERRIGIAMKNAVKEPAADVPFGLPQSRHEHFRMMYDLMALAFEGDITRSITFMLGRDLSGASFPESGFTGGWHGTSHHGDKPENIANYSKVNRYHVQNLAYFCEKLSKIPDGDGTVLDHVLIYKGSNMGTSHRHAHEKVPVILVGGIDGTFKGNRHLAFPDNTQRTSNMLLSLMHLYGIEMDKIGTSTGRLQPREMV